MHYALVENILIPLKNSRMLSNYIEFFKQNKYLGIKYLKIAHIYAVLKYFQRKQNTYKQEFKQHLIFFFTTRSIFLEKSFA